MSQQVSFIHPGEILLEEFLKPLNITQYRLAHDVCVSPRRINEIVLGKRSITADTALRLATYFGNSPEFWMNLQTYYEIEMVKNTTLSEIKKNVTTLQFA